MTPQPLSKLSPHDIQRLKEQQIEQERLQDVLLVLDQLFRREKVTATLVIDCLYDIGYVNLINQKIRPRYLQPLTKSLARMSKPLCRQVALMWVVENSPRLITNWLHSLVVFSDPDDKKSSEAGDIATDSSTEAQRADTAAEIERLRTQARLSTGVAIAAIVALIGTVFYTTVHLQAMPQIHPLDATAATVQPRSNHRCQ
ncbi:MAG: hypothetical protein NZ772_13010 [Cyanobacteria bacterium]|nr:hypothetical protein [Cyanobacteriota bacterium]MDW8202305.1 hypothetical protein [Cyanobacteriota bacterium SKYGB_h_bin112]